MAIPIGPIINMASVFILILTRMSGMFVVAPIFSRINIPVRIKVAFAFMVSLILLNIVDVQYLNDVESIYNYAILVAKEFLVGLTIGYISYMFFAGVYIAGQAIDFKLGFALINVLDPATNIQIPITAGFYYTVCMLVFLLADGHLFLISSLFESFDIVPLGTSAFSTPVMDDIIRTFGKTFILGLKIAAPIIATIFVVDVIIGIISKAVPQLNFFVIGMPLKIFVGLVIMMLSIRAFVYIVEVIITGMDEGILKLLQNLGGA